MGKPWNDGIMGFWNVGGKEFFQIPGVLEY
jgi:hypothetical protein